MQRITVPMFRYGEADFDKDYMTWGLHDPATQMEEAESILRIVGCNAPLQILDLACGTGTHAVHFAKRGHQVTAVDLSATFVEEGAKLASQNSVDVAFQVGDIKRLGYEGCFDVVTWIEKSFFDEEIVRAVHRYLAEDGYFIFDTRNPEHPKMKRLNSNWRAWREENGVFYLESHETDGESGLRHNLWIQIDANNDTIIERQEVARPCREKITDVLLSCGFRCAEYRTLAGDVFTGGEDPYWLWVVARK